MFGARSSDVERLKEQVFNNVIFGWYGSRLTLKGKVDSCHERVSELEDKLERLMSYLNVFELVVPGVKEHKKIVKKGKK